jgi:predicted nucleic acid-binding protein
VSFYLDASAIMPTLVQEASSKALSRFLTQAEDSMVVSEFAAAEVASGLSRLTRMGVLDSDTAGRHLADFDAWRAVFTVDLDLRAADVRLANIFVRRFDLGLRAPDALHAAICRRMDHTLVTLDRRLAAAAEALGVRVHNPAAAI